ncbi:MAG: hypothetical protein JSR46_01775 [Verrucomicrobia bacterium]|nr:hypothetical protein [Verrucomicrobiota bacterium]
MLATQIEHSHCVECEEEVSLFLSTSYEHEASTDSVRQNGMCRIVQLGEEIATIKGTLSVAF